MGSSHRIPGISKNRVNQNKGDFMSKRKWRTLALAGALTATVITLTWRGLLKQNDVSSSSPATLDVGPQRGAASDAMQQSSGRGTTQQLRDADAPKESESSAGDNEYAKSEARFQNLLISGAAPDYLTVTAGMMAEDLPYLYSVLDDPEMVRHWGDIVQMLGYLGNQSKTVPVLIEFLRRPEEGLSHELYAYTAKLGSLESLGLIGGPRAEEVLREALEPDGAENLTSAWLNAPALDDDRYRFLGTFSGAAAKGLIYTRDIGNEQLVEDAYRRARQRAEPLIGKTYQADGRDMDEQIQDAAVRSRYRSLTTPLAIRDLINDIGMERYKSLIYHSEERFAAIQPYLGKYWVD